jgi:hypothetical protein
MVRDLRRHRHVCRPFRIQLALVVDSIEFDQCSRYNHLFVDRVMTLP